MGARRHLFPFLFLLSIAAPSNAGPLEARAPERVLDEAALADQVATRGSLRLLTYNVAGLPEGISRSRPRANMPEISRLLNRYDLALVQEDFWFPEALRAHLELPHRSFPARRKSVLGFGDGLSRFGRLPFEDFMRVRWSECHGVVSHGSDCLAFKGFTVATHHLARGATVDVYNLHMDAGRAPADLDARRAQTDQLIRSIALRSKGRAVLLAGDTNMWRDDEETLGRLMEETGLRDACRELGCPDPRRIDRVLFRSAPDLSLRPSSWAIDERFVDAAKKALSDHDAVAVRFRWQMAGAGLAAAER
ncbi:MAG: endonuclease/exonuclease/phosphatase family protein [Myxococcota bacterium]